MIKTMHGDPAIDILVGLNAKGWNFYRHEDGLSPEQIIEKGPEMRLEDDVHYALLPAADNPKNPDSVFEKLEKLAVKLNRQMPSIEISGRKYDMLGITLREDGVKIHSSEGKVVSYSAFLEAIDSFIDFYKC